MSEELTTRRVLVTGGSRGIGASIVRLLAERGARVAFTYRTDLEAASRLVGACAELPGDVFPMPFDLVEGDPGRLVESACAAIGGVDSLILNAGMWRGGRLAKLDDSAWWGVLEANLRGNVRLVRTALPVLEASSAASILLMSSAVGLTGFPGDTAYASSKSALTGFARSLAKETGRIGTRVNVLAPGFVETDMTAEIGESARNKIIERSVLGRFGTPEEIAKAAVFLSEDATFATGVVLPIDGGWTL
ncbi:SDR family oxidoreductase [Aeromicrobium panaciterrae]|uniref:SDR family NAD(P)-dependent oxidoreductase n=1 Tax=Aeromicrobium panaciterrae TaxID=363861 RepID=UPI0031D71C6D